jgi:drug/metabolite transporter (DMT)-like permease
MTTAERGEPTTQLAPSRPVPAWLALASAALAAGAFVSMDATIKSLSANYGAVQLTFLRFFSGSLFAAAIWLWARSPMPTGALWKLHLVRSALLLVTLISYFHALSVLPLAQAVAIGYMAPIFIALLAMMFLNEKPAPSIWLALGLGLAGTFVALWPELQKGHVPQLVGLAAAAFSAVTFAGVMVLARVQAQRDSLWTILLLQNVLPTVALALPAEMLWQPLQPGDVPRILLAGFMATIGLVAITWAFKHVEASRAAPIEYTGLIWAALLGYALFGEVPSAWAWASAALIVLGSLLLVKRH